MKLCIAGIGIRIDSDLPIEMTNSFVGFVESEDITDEECYDVNFQGVQTLKIPKHRIVYEGEKQLCVFLRMARNFVFSGNVQLRKCHMLLDIMIGIRNGLRCCIWKGKNVFLKRFVQHSDMWRGR